jgi:drug/metabolite transporter (DMT)-like permease
VKQPLLLLLGTGIALGLNFPLGKLASSLGIPPALWGAYICLAAGLALGVVTAASQTRSQMPQDLWRFSVISGLISFVVPNLLTYTVIPKIGSGLTGMMFALSPMVTALLSFVLGVRPPNRRGFIGIGLGLAGAAIIILGKERNATGGISGWLILGLAIPLFLGMGNVYRTRAWPAGASPMMLASLTNLAAVPFLLVIELAMNGRIDITPLIHAPVLLSAQLLSSSVMFLMFFRLQQIGGPTYLSQIGYVAAAVGLGVGVGYFGEVYPPAVWLGALIVAAGIAVSTLAQRSATPVP